MRKDLKILPFLLFAIQYTGFSQLLVHDFKGGTGINRAGLFFDGKVGFNVNKNSFSIGMIYYGTNLVFEKNWPGIIGEYQYKLIDRARFCMDVGLKQVACFDQKSTNNLWFFDTNLNVESTFLFGGNWGVFTQIGSGIVTNLTSPKFYKPEKTTYIYQNYEVAVGIKYILRSFTAN